MKTVLVTGYVDATTRALASANLALLMSQNHQRVCLTSTDRNAYALDLLLAEGDEGKLRTSREAPGLFDLIAEYEDALLDSPADEAEPVPRDAELRYGTLSLRAPSSVLQTLQQSEGEAGAVRLLRGGPRHFSEQKPKLEDDRPVDWRDFFANDAGAAFFAHVQQDLEKEHDWLLLDCDAATERTLALLLAAMVDAVVLLSEYGDSTTSGAFHLALDIREHNQQRSAQQRPAILPFPAAVSNVEREMLARYREHFDRHFLRFAPEGTTPYWFVSGEIPDIPYYKNRNVLVAREDVAHVSVPLYYAYQYIAEMVRSSADNVPPPQEESTLAERFADALRRVRWDVFISYSDKDREIAAGLHRWLRKNALRSFFSPRDLQGEIRNRKWSEAIDSVLERSTVLVLLGTESALQSKHVRHELEEFARHRRLIVPLRVGDQVLPDIASDYQVVQWNGDLSSPAVQEILKLIRGGLGPAGDPR